MATSADYWWFLWPAAGVAISLLIEAVRIFAGNHQGKDWEERKIKKLKARSRKHDS